MMPVTQYKPQNTQKKIRNKTKNLILKAHCNKLKIKDKTLNTQLQLYLNISLLNDKCDLSTIRLHIQSTKRKKEGQFEYLSNFLKPNNFKSKKTTFNEKILGHTKYKN